MLLGDILAMSSPLRIATIATITSLLFAQPSIQQTYTKCNPLTQSNCPADPALGRSIYVDFTQGASNEFTSEGDPTYNGEGAAFSVDAAGDAPQVVSKWYIMFGKYEVTMKAAPGAGIVSSLVLQSDDLDEIDWEWLGAQDDEVQTNYFGKGETTDYDRSTTVSISDTQGTWHTYAVEWTSEQITWSIDGSVVRTLTPATADAGQYPQTPCQLKIGSWAGGDPATNPAGTVSWAQGPVVWSEAPFTMYVQSVSVSDYSTGTEYTYGDQSGDWTSIESKGGRVNGNVGAALPDTASAAGGSSPSQSVQAFAPAAASGSASVTYTTLPGLPSGWSVNPTTGKVVPPSSAPSISQPASFISSPAVSAAAGSLGCEYKTIQGYDQQGFATTLIAAVGAKTTYNDKGLPVTILPAGCGEASSKRALSIHQKPLATSAPSATSESSFATSTTATASPSSSSTDDSELSQSRPKGGGADTSGASTAAARWSTAFAFCFTAILFLA